MNCPLLQRHKLGPACQFAAYCQPPLVCAWAEFHQVDAVTGKPTQQAPQRDLFESTPTPGEPCNGEV